MGNCTCINETDRGPDIDLQVRFPIIHSRNPTLTPGESTTLGLTDSFPSPTAPTTRLPDVIHLQTAFRAYTARKRGKRLEQEWMDISLDLGVPGEAGADYSGDLRMMLSPEAAVVLARLTPFSYPKKVRGVVRLPAKHLQGGGVYVGQWAGEAGSMVRSGQGKLYQADGGLTEGYWKGGKVHFVGRVVYRTGDVYEGGFDSGLKSGSGSFTLFEANSTYVGEWERDQQHGKGTELLQDGTRYEGFFFHGEKTGTGKVKSADGTVYIGDFAYNHPNGTGEYRWADGRRYVGQVVNGKMHGQGELTYADGKRYKGGFAGDKKEGYGVYQWDGKTYEGEWEAGMMHGEGWLSGKEIGRKRYEFSRGNRVREVK